MDSTTFLELAGRLLRQATAPYHEHAVRAEAERFCAEQGLDHARDRFGNLFVRVRGRSRTRPLVLAAHMDHPGFEIVGKRSSTRWIVRFRGSVPDSFFRRGVRVRLVPGGTPAILGRRLPRRAKTFELIAEHPRQDAAQFAVWDLRPFHFQRGRIYSRSCDDVLGVAAVLSTMAELRRRRADVRVLGLLSRAEEVGFHGALAAAASAQERHGRSTWAALPRGALVVSVETSREMPGAVMEEGVVVRVGDKASIFHSEATRFLAEVASGLQQKRKHFRFQRALMSGGTCEATAFQQFGFVCSAVCVPLGNYHNCGSENRIQEEYVALKDMLAMVELLVSVSLSLREYQSVVKRLPRRLRKLLREGRGALSRSS